MRKLLIKFRGSRTQAELAEQYGVSQQAWSKWERGIDTPKPHIMKKLEMDSKIAMEELFFDVFNNYKLLKTVDNNIGETTNQIRSKLAG